MANTLFSFNIVSVYYVLWLKDQDLGGVLPDTLFAAGNIASMAVVLVGAPALGVLSDRVRRRIPMLVATTLICVAATIPLGLVAWPFSLALFVAANIGFQLGLVVYDSLLPVVTTPSTRGRVAGLGVGVGYLGSLLGLGMGSWILSIGPQAEPIVFIATGLGFLILALPAFAWIRETNEGGAGISVRSLASAVRDGFAAILRLLKRPDAPHMRRFLIGRAFYTDAANTMIIFMALYAVLEAGFTESSVQLVLLAGILGAALSAWPWGLLVDRVGPKHALDVVLLTWMFGLAVVAVIPVLDLPQAVFYPVSFILGGALAGLWTADRPLLLALAPKGRVGEFYGLYAMVGRFTAIVGPLLWAVMAEPRLLGWGRPAAVLALLAFMAFSFGVLRRLPDPVHPGRTPLRAFLPWASYAGRAPRRGWRRFVSFPFLLTYLIASWALFVPNAEPADGFYRLRPDWVSDYTYEIPELSSDPRIAFRSLATAPWLNHHSVQLVYVTVLLALAGFVFEAREGTRRTVLVFFATTLAGALTAGLLLHVIYPGISTHPFFQRAWEAEWSGGSAGAFGLMGALAARAKRPSLLLAFFIFWELNVGWWYLRSFTPAFHLTALATGFVLARFVLRPLEGGQGSAEHAGGGQPGEQR